MKFMLITNEPDVARSAEAAGVSRIFIDLEILGKQERQGHLDTHMSSHRMQDVGTIRSVINSAELLVRVNPLHQGTDDEIDSAVAAGADILMLPMFHEPQQLSDFIDKVDGRAKVMPLVETKRAAESMAELVALPGLDEIYIGLNDLHLDMGLKFMFELLASGYIDSLAEIIRDAGIPFGFGGIARCGEGAIPGELVLAEHLRLGSSCVILSRTFHRKGELFSASSANEELATELGRLFDCERDLLNRSDRECETDAETLRSRVRHHVEKVSQ